MILLRFKLFSFATGWGLSICTLVDQKWF